MQIYEIPLIASPQRFTVTLAGVTYGMALQYQNADEGGWTLDINDSQGNSLVAGIPLVTGINLLRQYPHLGFGGELAVRTDADPDAVPTFDNLGTASHLYFITTP